MADKLFTQFVKSSVGRKLADMQVKAAGKAKQQEEYGLCQFVAGLLVEISAVFFFFQHLWKTRSAYARLNNGTSNQGRE